MRFESIKILALVILYIPALLLGNAHITACVTESGKIQFEFAFAACDTAPVQIACSTPASDCGDCTDYKLKIGETYRMTFNSNFDLPPIQNAIFCQVVEQKLPCLPSHIQPDTSDPGLIGSSILII